MMRMIWIRRIQMKMIVMQTRFPIKKTRMRNAEELLRRKSRLTSKRDA